MRSAAEDGLSAGPCPWPVSAHCTACNLRPPVVAAEGGDKEGAAAEQQQAAGGGSGAQDDPEVGEAEDVMERTPEKVSSCSVLLRSQGWLLWPQDCLQLWRECRLGACQRMGLDGCGACCDTRPLICSGLLASTLCVLHCLQDVWLTFTATQGDDDYMGPSAGCTAVCALVSRCCAALHHTADAWPALVLALRGPQPAPV